MIVKKIMKIIFFIKMRRAVALPSIKHTPFVYRERNLHFFLTAFSEVKSKTSFVLFFLLFFPVPLFSQANLTSFYDRGTIFWQRCSQPHKGPYLLYICKTQEMWAKISKVSKYRYSLINTDKLTYAYNNCTACHFFTNMSYRLISISI